MGRYRGRWHPDSGLQQVKASLDHLGLAEAKGLAEDVGADQGRCAEDSRQGGLWRRVGSSFDE